MASGGRSAVPDPRCWEVLSVIRGTLHGGKIKPDHAAQAAAAVTEMDPVAVRTRLLAARIWELRNNLTTYDAAYVAAAERYRCALVTTDARLARAAGIQCTVNLIP